MKRLGVLCARVTLPALLAVAIMSAGERAVGTAPVTSALAPTAFVWSDRVFTSKTSFDQWLRARGSSYETWADRHPAAVAESSNRQIRPQLSALPATELVQTRRQHTLLLTLIVAGFVAVSLTLALLLRHVRVAVLRPMLAPALARVGSPAFAGGATKSLPASSAPAKARNRRRRPPRPQRESRPRGRVAQERVRTALVAAKTARRQIAVGTRPADPSLPPIPRSVRLRFWIRRTHARHPELAWYAVACSFALAVGAIVPLLVR
jgi:hypothetical protein